jgi:hypothetical protein
MPERMLDIISRVYARKNAINTSNGMSETGSE